MYEKWQFDSLVWGSLPFAPIRLSGIHMTPCPHGSTFVPFPDLISRPRRKTGRNPGSYHSYITDYYVLWSVYDHASSITDTPTYPSSLAPSVPSLPVDPSRGNSPDRVWYTISVRTFWTTCTHTYTHIQHQITNLPTCTTVKKTRESEREQEESNGERTLVPTLVESLISPTNLP